MRILKLIAAACLATALSASASAQFSVAGGGSFIPTSGTGQDVTTVGDGAAVWPTVQPGFQGNASVAVPVAVTHIDSIVVDGLAHTWIGDLQATLEDPNGVEHLIFLRPGFTGTGFGNSGDFTSGTYTFVEFGGSTLPTSGDAPAGTYNQSFISGSGASWTSGQNGINNTPLSAITGPAGTWKLNIYDWAAGDIGSFNTWTLNGNGTGPGNSGASDCDCSGGNSPCFTASGPDRGCPNSNGNGLGAMLVGSGNASIGSDTFSLAVSDAAPLKPGLVLAGTASLGPFGSGGVPDSAGVLCVSGTTRRGAVVSTDASGAASFPDFQGAPFGASDIVSAGSPISYTYWFRDPGTAVGCTGDTASSDFNFSNGWTVGWTL